MTIEICKIDCQPKLDVYKGNGLTDTSFWIDPVNTKCGVHQWRDDFCNGEYYRGAMYQFSIAGNDRSETPKESELMTFLEGERGQELLGEICDGLEWVGGRGLLNDSAIYAMNILESEIEALPRVEWNVWDVKSWFNGNDGITGGETDEDIRLIADKSEPDDEYTVVDGDIYDYLIQKRNELRSELE